MSTPQISQKATLNDAFRASGEGVMLTRGTQHLSDVIGLLDAVQTFDTFMEDNDPHSEHDFGSLEWCGEQVLWKIDYYDQSLEYYCDPLSKYCNRIICIMLADEY